MQNFSLNFAQLDLYGQIVTSSLFSSLDITLQNPQMSNFTPYQEKKTFIQAFSNITTVKGKDGFFNISGIGTDFWPDSSLLMNISTNALIDISSSVYLSIPNYQDFLSSNFFVELEFRNCTLGETFQSNGRCERCKENYYLINVNDNTVFPCLPCDELIAIVLEALLLSQNLDSGEKISLQTLLARALILKDVLVVTLE